MKVLIYLSAIFIILLFSDCNKNKFVPDDEVPQWLKERIAEDEAIIDTLSNPMRVCSAWIRYKFKNDYYFEYDNPVSSVMYEIYNFEGAGLDFLNEPYDTFLDDRCCKRFVWKSPGYEEYF